ncbi:MAG: solute carrier family 12 sodium/potassium/chloride transporter 2 [Myxococcota bacterium]|jgi:solute carrier family 12 sodium/potassium/chloride transporter 2
MTETAPAKSTRVLYGAFAGVFTPTILTILGVIMFLRLPWVVGNAGLFGAFLIMGVAIGITLCTGLSLSSIATNTRLGAGGPYAIISRSLGLEVGGSVGAPLYFSQALAVSMYIFGFREGLYSIEWFSALGISELLVDMVIFAVVFAIGMIGPNLAFRIQYVVMAILVVSLVCILGNGAGWDLSNDIVWFGNFEGSPANGVNKTSFWVVFAVFFPAATGVMAGANMSGDLKDPRVSIPKGTLGAILLSAVVYVVLAVWVARAGSTEELLNNYNFFLDNALWGPAVVAGLLGATFSSALASLVGAPRILMAMCQDDLVPRGAFLARTTDSGQPRNAMILTGVIVLGALMLRDLNLVAPLISMFFLISYAVINVVVLVEKSLGLSSFRPTLQVPWFVPLLGTVGCVFAMFIVNPAFGLVSVGIVVALFVFVTKRGVRQTEDVRSGIFAAFAEWAAAKVIQLDIENAKAWKPSLLVPVSDPSELRGEFRLLSDICRPEGSVKLMGIATRDNVKELTREIGDLGHYMRRQELFTTWSVLDSTEFREGLIAGLQALESAFFRPNILFLNLPTDEGQQEEVREMCIEARRLRVGMILLAMHEKAGLGRAGVINLWFRYRTGPEPVPDKIGQSNMHLAILIAWRLVRSWSAELNIIAVAERSEEEPAADRFLQEVSDLGRLPKTARRVVLVGTMEDCLTRAPQSDLDVMGLDAEPDMAYVRATVRLTRSSCLFTGDSGKESALV